MDKKDDCLRRACECDIRFAESMAIAENTWDVNFHTERNGGSWKYNEQTRFLTLESRGPNHSTVHKTKLEQKLKTTSKKLEKKLDDTLEEIRKLLKLKKRSSF